jgi:hypothetical protein
MTDFKSLDPEIRAYALVGQFLKRWSELETRIHEAIGAALGIDETRRYILCANLHLKDKIHVLQSLVHQSSFSSEVKEETNKELTAILNYTKRNMIAHDAFDPDPEGDGVVFLPVKARQTFSRPRERWSIAKFEEEGQTISGFSENVTRLKAKFPGATFELPPIGWMEGMQGSAMPIRRPFRPDLYDPQSHLVPMPLRSGQPNPKKDDQTPEEPRE